MNNYEKERIKIDLFYNVKCNSFENICQNENVNFFQLYVNAARLGIRQGWAWLRLRHGILLLGC